MSLVIENSEVVKNSDLQHIFKGGLYTEIFEAESFGLPTSDFSEQQINEKLKLLARPEGFNIEFKSIICIPLNVRMIAQRLGNNPATKIFMWTYKKVGFTCYACDDQNHISRIDISKNGSIRVSDTNDLSSKGGLCRGILGDIPIALSYIDEKKDDSIRVPCHISHCQEVKIIRELFKDQQEMLPGFIRDEVFPPIKG